MIVMSSDAGVMIVMSDEDGVMIVMTDDHWWRCVDCQVEWVDCGYFSLFVGQVIPLPADDLFSFWDQFGLSVIHHGNIRNKLLTDDRGTSFLAVKMRMVARPEWQTPTQLSDGFIHRESV